MTDKTDIIESLNDLIRTSEDGAKGFLAAAERADDPSLKKLLQDRSESCAHAARELQQAVRDCGGTPEESGSAAGAAHRGWVKARAAVGDSNVAVLEEVERGEDVAKSAYARVLKANLPADVRGIVERQYQGVLKNHDRIRDLRDQYRASA